MMDENLKINSIEAMLDIAKRENSPAAAALARLMATDMFEDINKWLSAERERPNAEPHAVIHALCLGFGLSLGFTLDIVLKDDTPPSKFPDLIDKRIKAIRDMTHLSLTGARNNEEQAND